MATTTRRFARPQDEALPGMPEQPGPDVGILPTGVAHKIQSETIGLSGSIAVSWRDGLDHLRHDDTVIVTITNADGQTIGFAQCQLESNGYKTHHEDNGPEWLEKRWKLVR